MKAFNETIPLIWTIALILVLAAVFFFQESERKADLVLMTTIILVCLGAPRVIFDGTNLEFRII